MIIFYYIAFLFFGNSCLSNIPQNYQHFSTNNHSNKIANIKLGVYVGINCNKLCEIFKKNGIIVKIIEYNDIEILSFAFFEKEVDAMIGPTAQFIRAQSYNKNNLRAFSTIDSYSANLYIKYDKMFSEKDFSPDLPLTIPFVVNNKNKNIEKIKDVFYLYINLKQI